jgi:hypothetical protein
MFRTHAMAALLAALMAHLPIGAVTPVHKCVVNGTITYQRDPCPSGRMREPAPTPSPLNVERKKPRSEVGPAPGVRPVPAPAAQGSPSQPPAAEPPAQGKADGRASAVAPIESAGRFKCDGRTHCSQMTSCAEAKYFLANCPRTKMDGDGDGIPCEAQWCRR